MKTWELETNVTKLVERFNLLPNKSGTLTWIYNFMSKDYELRGLTGEDTEIIIFISPYLAEFEGVIEGLIIANDYDYFGKDTKNSFYRYDPKPKYSK